MWMWVFVFCFFCYHNISNDLKYHSPPPPPPPPYFCCDRNSKTVLASVPTGKIDVSSIFFSSTEGSDKLVRAGLLICTVGVSFLSKGPWEIPSDAPFICMACRPACNLRDIVADNRTCPLWTQRTISRGRCKIWFLHLFGESISVF